ncbi:MAG: hypothetical protein GYB64_11215 [Chloroflexi bacterium]|nr:hypothetical protein [Chloroflexota bacterium]
MATVRPGISEDWETAQTIIKQSTPYDEGRITRDQWDYWVDDASSSFPIMAEERGLVAGFAVASAFGTASWWLDGPVILPQAKGHGFEQLLTDSALAIFKEHGAGILRTASFDSSEHFISAVRSVGFRNIISYTRMRAKAAPGETGPLLRLPPHSAQMVYRYLQNSPLHRINRFIETQNVLDFITDTRLADYLNSPTMQLLGWRQFDKLHGVVVIRLDPPEQYANALYISYLDAPDDTTLRTMLETLRVLAHQRGKTHFVWKMPLSIGLERQLKSFAWEQTWDEPLRLYERGLRI